MSAKGLIRREAGCLGACKGVLIREKTQADAANDTALATNDASRPKIAAKNPPMAAPMASMIPHVEPRRALARFSSSGSRARLGIDA